VIVAGLIVVDNFVEDGMCLIAYVQLGVSNLKI